MASKFILHDTSSLNSSGLNLCDYKIWETMQQCSEKINDVGLSELKQWMTDV